MDKETKLFINKLNEEENKKIKEEILLLSKIRNQIAILKQQELGLEQWIVKSNLRVVGIQELNLRVSITPEINTMEIDHLKTIENQENQERFYKTIVQEILDKEFIEEELKDKLVYKPKIRKSLVVFRTLDKETEEE